jgi:hypothetical protein
MPKYEVGEEVIVHHVDVRGRDEGEVPGKIVSVARILVDIEYTPYEGSRVRTEKFRMDTKHRQARNGEAPGVPGPWFETPKEKELRLAVEAATEILKKHGFEFARRNQPSDAKIIGVAQFLTKNYRQ